MNTITTTGAFSAPAAVRQTAADVLAYYEETADDFKSWSAAGNMHFGFCNKTMDPFDRDAQLAQMNREVGQRLALPGNDPARIVDLGCGNGASCRQLLQENPGWHTVGLNIVADQIKTAQALARDAKLNHRSTFLCENYSATSFPAGRFDGAIAIESSCYAKGYSKTDFLREAKRLIRPGARLVVADYFFRDARPLPPLVDSCHRHMCESWALDTLAQKPAFEKALQELGFLDIRFEDISINVLPSAMQIPVVSARFMLDLLSRPSKATSKRRGHAVAPLFGLLLALSRSRLGYFLVSATRG